jgi:hypothetical protein
MWPTLRRLHLPFILILMIGLIGCNGGQYDPRYTDYSLHRHKGFNINCIINVDTDAIMRIGNRNPWHPVFLGVMYATNTDYSLEIYDGDTAKFIGTYYGNSDDPNGTDSCLIGVDPKHSHNIVLHIHHAKGNPCIRIYVTGRLNYRSRWYPLLSEKDVQKDITVNIP